MDIYLRILRSEESEFADMLRTLFEKFPLAVTEFLRMAYFANIESIEHLFTDRNNPKHSNLFSKFFKEGLVSVDMEFISKSTFELFQQQLEFATRFVQAKIYAKETRVVYGGARALSTIPDREFDSVRSFV